MAPPGFRSLCDDLLERAAAAGWEVREDRPLEWGRQFVLVQHGAARAILSCYHGRKGFRWVPGGPAGDALAATLGGAPRARPEATSATDPVDPFAAGVPRIGADESGKGDYFGPLVVAAWHLDGDEARTLRDLGVADSKGLSPAQIERIAGRLDDIGHGRVLALMPREYNVHYATVRNVNLLLSELHGTCIRELVGAGRAGAGRAEPAAVVVDRYARDVRLLARTARLPARCRLLTPTRGEADPAVAAASILARAAFVAGLRDLGHEFGFTLPPGAGAPVLQAGRAFVRDFGRERLAEVAKVHFATSRQF